MMGLLTDSLTAGTPAYNQRQAERQSRAPNQPGRKLRSQQTSPLMRAINRPSNYNTSVPGSPGRVAAGGPTSGAIDVAGRLRQTMSGIDQISAIRQQLQNRATQPTQRIPFSYGQFNREHFSGGVNAVEPMSPFNRSVLNAPGVVRGGGRLGVVTEPTNSPLLNAITERRIAAENARKQRIAENVAANYEQRNAGVQGSMKEYALGDRNRTGFTGLIGQRADGTTGWMSDTARTAERMNADQRLKWDAMLARKDARRLNFLEARAAKREEQKQQAQLAAQDPLNSPLLRRLSMTDPRAAATLYGQLSGQQTESALQRAILGQRA
ncbi:MAG: hypothetical protein KDA51_05340, partial [Planctomycetales bacterium]|nr:hypothetical protein [Planctomycetales bacterium]